LELTMNTNRIAAMGAVAVAVLAAGGILLHNSTRADAATHTMTFVARDVPGNETMDDLGEPSTDGPDLGDLLAFTQDLTQDGKDAGQVHVAAVGVDHQRRFSQASGTLVLKDGDIEIAGIVPMAPTFTLVVTGGTAHYAGVSGTLDFGLDGDNQTLAVHLKSH
jgi:hypothetical protein